MRAIQPKDFPWFDYTGRGSTFSLGLDTGGLLVMSGQTASEADPSTNRLVVLGGIQAQARVAYAKIQAIVEASGLRLSNVVQLVEYVVPEALADYPAVEAVRVDFFGLHQPVVNTVVIDRLLRPNALIEVDATAGVDKPSRARVERSQPAFAPGGTVDSLIFLPSLVPGDGKESVADQGDLRAQLTSIYERAERLLSSFDVGLDKVVRVREYLVPSDFAGLEITREFRRQKLGPTYPATTSIFNKQIGATRGARVQVDLVASREQSSMISPPWWRQIELGCSAAAVVGNVVWISAQAAVSLDGKSARHGGDVVKQAESAYLSIRSILEERGSFTPRLVKTTEYLTPSALGRYSETKSMRSRLLDSPYPVATGVVCHSLGLSGLEIAVDAMAVVE